MHEPEIRDVIDAIPISPPSSDDGETTARTGPAPQNLIDRLMDEIVGLRQEIEELRSGQKAIREQITAIEERAAVATADIGADVLTPDATFMPVALGALENPRRRAIRAVKGV
jgi:hypothetical protein